MHLGLFVYYHISGRKYPLRQGMVLIYGEDLKQTGKQRRAQDGVQLADGVKDPRSPCGRK